MRVSSNKRKKFKKKQTNKKPLKNKILLNLFPNFFSMNVKS